MRYFAKIIASSDLCNAASFAEPRFFESMWAGSGTSGAPVIPRVRDSLVLRPVVVKKPPVRNPSDENRAP